jgi:hypothetical protein
LEGSHENLFSVSALSLGERVQGEGIIMSNFGPTLITVLGGIFTLAMIAVLVSQKAQTSTLISGAGTALSSVINAAVAPVSGSSTNQLGSTTAIGGVTN